MPEYDGRYELEWRYNVDAGAGVLSHVHSFDLNVIGDADPGSPFENVEIQPRVGASVSLGDWIQEYANVFTPMQGTGTAIEEIILWRYDDEPATSKIFIASATTLPTPDYGGLPVVAQGTIFTFRVSGYRYPMRMYLMEGNFPDELRIPYAAVGTPYKEYMDFVISPDSPIVGRSDGYPIAGIAMNNGQNEKLRDIRYR